MSGTSDGGVDEHDAESSVKRGQLLGDIAAARGAGAQHGGLKLRGACPTTCTSESFGSPWLGDGRRLEGGVGIRLQVHVQVHVYRLAEPSVNVGIRLGYGVLGVRRNGRGLGGVASGMVPRSGGYPPSSVSDRLGKPLGGKRHADKLGCTSLRRAVEGRQLQVLAKP
eukprot:scaffold1470_cov118-Isochrysis_galbana.AAC.4